MSNDVETLFRKLTLGVYVIGVSHEGSRDAFTAACVMQTSYTPLMLALSIGPDHAAYPLLRDGGSFTVNVLDERQTALARHFGTRSGRDEDKLNGLAWRQGLGGDPILDEALAYFDCVLTAITAAGDHQLVVGRVVDGGVVDPDGIPLAYSDTGDMDGSSALYPESF